ncbi:MAG: hypothetical protein ACJ0RJ_02450 [Alphaproteobacteria bacterium]
MINLLLKYFFIKFLSFKIQRNKYKNFNDLNFKQNDFINYKIIKNYIVKDNFIHNDQIADIHTFNFLFFYQRLGGKKGIHLSKKNIFLWFKKYKYYKNYPWSDDLSSKRFINIIYNYDFICSIPDTHEIKLINYILNFHIKRILFDFKRKQTEEISSFEILAFFIIQSLKNNLDIYSYKKLKDFIDLHVDENSMHKSYNILEHSKFLNNLKEVKNILLFFNLKLPNYLNNQILGMTSIIKNYNMLIIHYLFLMDVIITTTKKLRAFLRKNNF